MKRQGSRLLAFILMGSIVLCSQLNWRAEASGKSGNSGKSPRAIVVFVDMSGSTNKARLTLYKEAFEKVYQNLGQGDRIVVGTITGRSYIDFKATVDEEIPIKTIWVNRLQFENNLTKTKNKIRKEVNRLLSCKEGTSRTEILNSLNIADTIFHNEQKRHKILVVLSDMIQDSLEYNFAKDEMSIHYIDKIIRFRQNNNLIPKLTGVKVYVAGASAADSGKFRSIQNFWTGYFNKSGADFSPHRYGHSLINFENSL